VSIFDRRKVRVCAECRCYFEPLDGIDSRWSYLCETHAKPVRERFLRQDAVVEWAKRNWEKLEPELQKEREAQTKTEYGRLQSLMGGGGANIAGSPFNPYGPMP